MRIFDGGPRRPSIYRGCHQSRRGKSRGVFAFEGDCGRETDGTRMRVRGGAARRLGAELGGGPATGIRGTRWDG